MCNILCKDKETNFQPEPKADVYGCAEFGLHNAGNAIPVRAIVDLYICYNNFLANH